MVANGRPRNKNNLGPMYTVDAYMAFSHEIYTSYQHFRGSRQRLRMRSWGSPRCKIWPMRIGSKWRPERAFRRSRELRRSIHFLTFRRL